MTADGPTLTGQTEYSTADSSPATDGQQELQEQIAQTRQELGDTVAALAAKADLRARARSEAGQVRARIGERAGEVTQRASHQAGQIQHGAREVFGKLRQTVAAQPPRRRAVAALTAVGVIAAGAWLVQRGRHRKAGRGWLDNPLAPGSAGPAR